MRVIRSRLAYHGLTIRDLSEAIGISEGALYNKLNGKKKWWLDDAVAVTNYFQALGDDISIDELYETGLHEMAKV